MTVLEEAEPIGKRKRIAWLCRCDCGTEKVVKGEDLRNGDTKSCGCLNDEKRSERAPHMYEVCIRYTPEMASAHKIWKARGYNEGMSFDEFYELSQMDCFFCGAKPSNVSNSAKYDKKSSDFAKTNGDFIYNALKKINIELQYTKENSSPCCKECEKQKG